MEVDVGVGLRERVYEDGDELWSMEEILVNEEVDRTFCWSETIYILLILSSKGNDTDTLLLTFV